MDEAIRYVPEKVNRPKGADCRPVDGLRDNRESAEKRGNGHGMARRAHRVVADTVNALLFGRSAPRSCNDTEGVWNSTLPYFSCHRDGPGAVGHRPAAAPTAGVGA